MDTMLFLIFDTRIVSHTVRKLRTKKHYKTDTVGPLRRCNDRLFCIPEMHYVQSSQLQLRPSRPTEASAEPKSITIQ